ATRRQFMAAFAEAVYEANEEPLHLVFDEADLWAPQRPIKGWVDLLRKSGEFPMSYEELDDTAATVYEGI
ncbi:MAG: hypothetical protein ACJ8AW_54540, partial [Rhodopila sp.]